MPSAWTRLRTSSGVRLANAIDTPEWSTGGSLRCRRRVLQNQPNRNEPAGAAGYASAAQQVSTMSLVTT